MFRSGPCATYVRVVLSFGILAIKHLTGIPGFAIVGGKFGSGEKVANNCFAALRVRTSYITRATTHVLGNASPGSVPVMRDPGAFTFS